MATILMVAATAVTVIGQIKQGQQQAAAEKYNAQVAYQNAEVYRQTGKFETATLKEQGKYEQQRIAREKRQALSTQRALYGKSGVRIFEGSPLEVQADTAAEFELDIAASRYNVAVGAERIRYETDVGVARSESEARYRRRSAKSYRRASYWKAGATLLTAAASQYGGGSSGSVTQANQYLKSTYPQHMGGG